MASCSVCIEPVYQDAETLSCGHTFHASCLLPWVLRGNTHCPNCRGPCVSRQEDALPRPTSVIDISDDEESEASESLPYWRAHDWTTASAPLLHFFVTSVHRRAAQAKAAPKSLKLALSSLMRLKRSRDQCISAHAKCCKSAVGTYKQLRRLRTQSSSRLVRVSDKLVAARRQFLKKCQLDRNWCGFLESKHLPTPPMASDSDSESSDYEEEL